MLGRCVEPGRLQPLELRCYYDTELHPRGADGTEKCPVSERFARHCLEEIRCQTDVDRRSEQAQRALGVQCIS
ncbi:MAG: hypothetical protein AMS20_00710 [Gemmatimonas sp. SG8_28]|jgi:hypothetical protein|nr:MAG: hypothetical protein AMS20_00710 [Gemmatimonas sp. SG8_28]